ncbi:D-glutamate cyclase family protein [Chloroflexota bacterium]
MANYTREQLAKMSPRDFRSLVRSGEWTTSTEGVSDGYAMANLVIVPKDIAIYFLIFCHRNPRPFPLIDVTEPGDPEPKLVAPGADLRTDIPKYRVWENGECIDEPIDIIKYWRDDLVGFLIGCSISVDPFFKAANIQYRFQAGYLTNLECHPVGPFKGRIICSCRIYKDSYEAIKSVLVSARYPLAHGTPVHIGDPALVGVTDITNAAEHATGADVSKESLKPGEIATFTPAGASGSSIAQDSKIPFMITHLPFHMFISDVLLEEQSIVSF